MIKVASLNISGGFYIGSEDTEYLDKEDCRERQTAPFIQSFAQHRGFHG